jgi:RHS repeat-associated protein
MGRDGNTFGTMNSNVGRDAFSYTLGYFDGDYTPVSSFSTWMNGSPTSSGLANSGTSLYNGNIRYMTVGMTKPAIDQTPQELLPVTAYAFRYDQLNRLKISKTFINNQGSFSATDDYLMKLSYDFNGNIDTLVRNGFAPTLEMDKLVYSYNAGTNQLNNVYDAVPEGNYDKIDIDAQGIDNYKYDKTGNLVHDEKEEIEMIGWTLSGKIKFITRKAGSDKSDLEFLYDPMGNRFAKIEKTRTAAGLNAETSWNYTFYSRDAQGNIMANYFLKHNPQSNKYVLSATELDIYGSSRLGVVNTLIKIDSAQVAPVLMVSAVGSVINPYGTVSAQNLYEAQPRSITTGIIQQEGVLFNEETLEEEPISPADTLVPFPNWFFTFIKDSLITGHKRYELVNHLGNVMATISDRKIAVDNSIFVSQPGGDWSETPPIGSNRFYYTPGTGGFKKAAGTDELTDYYIADVKSSQDYYPFGMEMPGRKFSPEKYKFGFNGKLKDDEVYGEGNFQDYGFRMYDTRVCRFISVDPLTNKYPELTPFQFASNSPIRFIDMDGLEKDEPFFFAYKNAEGGQSWNSFWMNVDRFLCRATPDAYNDNRFDKKEVPVPMKILANVTGGPLISVANVINMASTNKTIYNEKATPSDYVSSVLDVATSGMSSIGTGTVKGVGTAYGAYSDVVDDVLGPIFRPPEIESTEPATTGTKSSGTTSSGQTLTGTNKSTTTTSSNTNQSIKATKRTQVNTSISKKSSGTYVKAGTNKSNSLSGTKSVGFDQFKQNFKKQ